MTIPEELIWALAIIAFLCALGGIGALVVRVINQLPKD